MVALDDLVERKKLMRAPAPANQIIATGRRPVQKNDVDELTTEKVA
jgi:hypothetical protein